MTIPNTDEKYIESLDPMERKVLFTTIRRIIREKKRARKIQYLENEKYEEADLIEVSDDSDSGKLILTMGLTNFTRSHSKRKYHFFHKYE